MFMLAMPVLTFLVLCSLSVAGVVLGANKFESDQRNAADAAALDWVSLNLSVCSMCSSSHTHSPSCSSIAQQSQQEARKACKQLRELAPQGCAAVQRLRTAALAHAAHLHTVQRPVIAGHGLMCLSVCSNMLAPALAKPSNSNICTSSSVLVPRHHPSCSTNRPVAGHGWLPSASSETAASCKASQAAACTWRPTTSPMHSSVQLIQ